ncbi:MAG: MlaD family protein [Gemmatimonadota bacterium]|nr:MlaD family protein [Gemmatimonadota bacterium]
MAAHARQERLGWREVGPGLGILGALLLLSAFSFFLDSIRRAVAEGPRLYVATGGAMGLQPGSEVWVGGVKAGRVVQVRFAPPTRSDTVRAVVEAVLLNAVMPELRHDSRVTIGAAALLAPAVVKIVPGSADSPRLESGDTLFVQPTPDLQRFLELAESMREEVAALQAADGSYRALLESGRGSAARFLSDPGSLVRLDSVRVQSNRIAAALREGGGLARAFRDDSLHASARRAREAVLGLRDQPFLAGLPDSLRALSEVAASVARRAERIGAGLEEAQGTAGRAASDPALRERAAEARAALRTLTEELAANPLRWLRFRIF